jgi:hypothetical protein
LKEPGYAVVWPRGKQIKEEARLAKRLNTLDDKTIGFLWHGIFFGDEMFPVIEKELAKRYPRSKFVSYEVFGLMDGGNEAKVIAGLPDKLRQYKCDAVISGVGC